jgi:hypothetical protein
VLFVRLRGILFGQLVGFCGFNWNKTLGPVSFQLK